MNSARRVGLGEPRRDERRQRHLVIGEALDDNAHWIHPPAGDSARPVMEVRGVAEGAELSQLPHP